MNQAILRTQCGKGRELFSNNCSKSIFSSILLPILSCVSFFSSSISTSSTSIPALTSPLSQCATLEFGLFFSTFLCLLGGGRHFRNANVINITGGVVMEIPIKDTMMVVVEILITPSCKTPSAFSSSEEVKNMALAIIVRKSKESKHDKRWTRVKMLLWGLMNMDSHKCCSVIFDCVCSENRVLKDVMSSLHDTGIILSSIPSSSSTANHLSHKKIYLKIMYYSLSYIIKCVPLDKHE